MVDSGRLPPGLVAECFRGPCLILLLTTFIPLPGRAEQPVSEPHPLSPALAQRARPLAVDVPAEQREDSRLELVDGTTTLPLSTLSPDRWTPLEHPAAPMDAGPELLAPGRRPEAMHRLPPLSGDEPTRYVAAGSERDIVYLAAGAVSLRPPRGWQIWEQAAGRELRLVLSPPPNGGEHVAGADQIWLAFHARGDLAGVAPPQLLAMLEQRGAVLDAQAIGTAPAETGHVDQFPMVLQAWARGAAPTVGREPSLAPVEGRHLLVGTPWGLLEVYGRFSAAHVTERLADWNDVVASLRLAAPRGDAPSVVPHAAAATAILGSWKSYRGRMRIAGTGRVQMVLDPPAATRVDQGPSPPREFAGEFVARDDVLFVTWADGSRANYRWRLEGDSLLLTDHDGQISLLRRLLE